MRTSQKTAGIITTIGIDLGKNTFHLIGFDRRGAIILQQKVSRGQLRRSAASTATARTSLTATRGWSALGANCT